MSLQSDFKVQGLVREVLEQILYQQGIQEYESSLVTSLAVQITRHVVKQLTSPRGRAQTQSETRFNTRNDMLKLAKAVNRKSLPKKFKRRLKHRRVKNLNAAKRKTTLNLLK